MTTQQNTETTPAPATGQAETPQPIDDYRLKIRFPLPALYPLSDTEKEQLQIFLVILRRYEGSTTPIEQFINDVVYGYGRHPVTLDDIEQAFDVLAQTWEDAVNIAARFNREYPELVTADTQEAQGFSDEDKQRLRDMIRDGFKSAIETIAAKRATRKQQAKQS